jgi:phenylalanine-4-hydroxylase
MTCVSHNHRIWQTLIKSSEKTFRDIGKEQERRFLQILGMVQNVVQLRAVSAEVVRPYL